MLKTGTAKTDKTPFGEVLSVLAVPDWALSENSRARRAESQRPISVPRLEGWMPGIGGRRSPAVRAARIDHSPAVVGCLQNVERRTNGLTVAKTGPLPAMNVPSGERLW